MANLENRLSKLEERSPVSTPQQPVWRRELDRALHLCNFNEVQALRDAARLAKERGHSDDNLTDDTDFVGLTAELLHRANARRTLPPALVKHVLFGHGRTEPWSLDRDIDRVRQALALDLECHGFSHVDLRELTVEDIAALVLMRTNGPGVVASGYSLRNVDLVDAERVAQKILVDGQPLRLAELPGIAEESAGAPLSQDELHLRYMRKAHASDRPWASHQTPNDYAQNSAEQKN